MIIEMLLWCPMCGARHLDEGEFATKPHHTHACQECGMVWRPAIVNTTGVMFLPGFKNAVALPSSNDVLAEANRRVCRDLAESLGPTKFTPPKHPYNDLCSCEECFASVRKTNEGRTDK